MLELPWEQTGSQTETDPPAPILELLVVGASKQQTLLRALFDTGSDVTLVQQAELGRLDVPLSVCGPIPYKEADGSDSWRPLTILQCIVDGNDIAVPAIFIRSGDPPGRTLFGRTGLADTLRTISDPVTRRMTFEWVAADAFETSEMYRRDWKAWLAAHPEGYDPDKWGGVD